MITTTLPTHARDADGSVLVSRSIAMSGGEATVIYHVPWAKNWITFRPDFASVGAGIVYNPEEWERLAALYLDGDESRFKE